jgi:hypothetical protein
MSDSSLSPETVEELQAELQRWLCRRVVGLRVLVRQDRVVLQGRAFTYHAKQLAQHAVLQRVRPHFLVNEIEVLTGFDSETSGDPVPRE